jgi:zinc transport system ATP-binding protein
MDRSTGPLIRAQKLVVGHRGRALLPAFDLEVFPGEFWAVLGRNGSGKSTVFRTLLGLLPPVQGSIQRDPAVPLAYVAQRLSFDDLYPVTVSEVVQMGTIRRGRWWGLSPRHPQLQEAMAAAGVDVLAHRTFRSLSEGQKQRVLLARMVASGARLAILDEPTAAMDAVAEREAMNLLDGLRSRFGIAVMVVSHHLDEPRRLADRALFLDPDEGRCVSGTPAEVFGHESFRARYGTDEVDRLEAP